MNRGRKNLKKAASEQDFTLEECQIIVQVVSLRSSNHIEIMDAKGENSLAYFPAKFSKSMWIRRGSFVVIDNSGKEKAQEFGRKLTASVCKVLFFEQVRLLQKSPDWPEIFRDVRLVPAEESSEVPIVEKGGDGEDDSSDDDDDGMAPLEANTNRSRMFGVQCEADKDSESDSDSDSDL